MTSIVLENVSVRYGKTSPGGLIRVFARRNARPNDGTGGNDETGSYDETGGNDETDGGVKAIDNLSLEIPDGGLIAIVGPSGCGKTTLLRVIAGLERVNSGRILFDGNEVTRVAARDRKIAMVFQSDALYSHLSARQNMAFGQGLRFFGQGREAVRQHPERETTETRFDATDNQTAGKSATVGNPQQNAIDRNGINSSEASESDSLSDRSLAYRPLADRIQVAAERLGIVGLLDRRPSQLSGGERQRVAIGRALVRDPAAFLLDEPFSNIDPALRNDARNFVEETHKNTRGTMILVTHQREDAMLAEQVVVMGNGTVEQVGTPAEIIRQPCNRFAASFFARSPMNFFPATDEIVSRLTGGSSAGDSIEAGKLIAGICPHDMTFGSGRASVQQAKGSATDQIEFSGRIIAIRDEGFTKRTEVELSGALPGCVLVVYDDTTFRDTTFRDTTTCEVGQLTTVSVAAANIQLFDSINGRNIRRWKTK